MPAYYCTRCNVAGHDRRHKTCPGWPGRRCRNCGATDHCMINCTADGGQGMARDRARRAEVSEAIAAAESRARPTPLFAISAVGGRVSMAMAKVDRLPKGLTVELAELLQRYYGGTVELSPGSLGAPAERSPAARFLDEQAAARCIDTGEAPPAFRAWKLFPMVDERTHAYERTRKGEGAKN